MTISAEELERRLYQRSTTDPEDRNRCEECGATNLIPRKEGDPTAGNRADTDAPYRCPKCHQFVEGSA